MNRRGFLRFLGALAPGLALARAGMGASLPTLPAVGLDAWLPGLGYIGTIRSVGWIYCTAPGYNAVIQLSDDDDDDRVPT